jgi:hypothetical protein
MKAFFIVSDFAGPRSFLPRFDGGRLLFAIGLQVLSESTAADLFAEFDAILASRAEVDTGVYAGIGVLLGRL